MALFIGIPIVLVWVIGFPLYITLTLWQKRKELDKMENIIKFGLFYIGLNDDSFYWEILISNGRKLFFILCSTLLSSL
jgi:hypothetical protein